MAESPKEHFSSYPSGQAANKQKNSPTKGKDKKQEKPAVLRAVPANADEATKTSKKNGKKNSQGIPQVAWGEAFGSIFSTIAKEAEQCQGTFFAIGCEGVENVNNFAETAFRGFDDAITFQNDNLESLFVASNATYRAAQTLQQLFSKAYEKQFPTNANAFQGFLQCKTANDWAALQSKYIKNNLDASLEVFSGLSQAFLDFSSEVLEPVGERMVSLSKQVSARFAEAA